MTATATKSVPASAAVTAVAGERVASAARPFTPIRLPVRKQLGQGIALLFVLACARMEPPPGGPPDVAPPQLVTIAPDSLARIPDFDGEVEFQFDEVVSEGGQPSQGSGTGDLEKLVILSPTTRVPDVHWRRTRITVRPDEGWQRDRVYRVQLLPGVTDLRSNRSDTGAVITFTTGAPLPSTTLEGLVVDWTTSRPLAEALVVALLLPDSLPYRALSDSTGRFSFGPLPAGEYLVSGVQDENRNLRADPREAYDTARVRRGAGRVGELWAFVHDTTPPRVREVMVSDSLAATVELTQMLDPKQRLTPAAVSLQLLPDSTAVAVASILPKPLDDSLNATAAARADSAAKDSARADSAAVDSAATDSIRRAGPGRGRRVAEPRPQLTTRPPLFDRLVIRVRQPWRPAGRYALTIRGVRNVTGVAGDVAGTVAVPERQAPDSLRKPADSLRQRQDSLNPRADSLNPRADSLRRRADSLKRVRPRRK